MFHVKHEAWPEALARLGVDLDGDALETLDRYEDLLRARATDLGLIASGDLPRLRDRHLLDSLRALPLLPATAGSLCDLGSGAGLPGLVIAIARPQLAVTLTEIRRRRVAFLELVVDRLGLRNVRIAGDWSTCPGPFDVCTARAFRDARTSWAAANGLLAPEGALVYWAGSGFDRSDLPQEVRAALRTSTLAWSGPLVIMSRQ
jgi:16S rRNA (guanine527-N7)-methyltransferase